MSLSAYKQKRSPGKTPEPFGGKSAGTQLHFVIQKHAASHLHYDFRLEMGGVLKSWAVPKGPSLDPGIKRLAMMVEDHPFDYRNFEGIIPVGQYGGGTVMVWDEGTYEPAEIKEKDRKAQEKSLLHQLYSGKLKFTLHGKKLKGMFALVKAAARGENGWLLMKLDDKYAGKEDITLKDKSVRSKKTIEQIAHSATNIYSSSAKKKGRSTGAVKTAKKAATIPEPVKKIKKKIAPIADSTKPAGSRLKRLLDKATEQAFYTSVKPMLATLVDKPFDDEGWLYEIKWDGYRAVSFMNNNKIELKSRNDKSFNDKYYPVHEALKDWPVDAIVDGEIVVVKENGHADFASLQNWRSEADGTLLYYLFDILWYNGYNVTHLPLTNRKAILKELLPADSIIKASDDFETSGIEFLEAARKMGLEGIMAKRKDSKYLTGGRSREWLKIKANKRQEVVIGGYTNNVDSSKPFSSLLVGVFEKGKFIYTGKIGTGFNIQQQKGMLKQFQPLITQKPAFSEEPDVNKPSRFRPNPPKAEATWLKPQLICEVSYAEMTTDGVMRHPSFEGMRNDKKAKEVVLEKEIATEKVLESQSSEAIVQPVKKGDRKTLLNPKDKTQVRKVGGHELRFTNLDKIFWPKEKYTKRDLINYYYQVASYILPYLKDRPQSMNRFPDGITGEGFYFKDVTGKAPDWVHTFLYHSDADNKDRNYLVGYDEATLLYMANLGCIEMNPWSSTIKKPDYPTFCIIDLDPGGKTSFEQVIEAAQVTRQVLEDMGVVSYPKTSGSTGMHIYIPLGNKYTYEQSKELARVIVMLVHQQIPKYTSIKRTVKARKGLMYLDFLQNRPHATIAAPYSVRPKPGATVSMPLHWDEVKKGLKMADFTMRNAVERIKAEGDLFKPVLGKGIDLKKVIQAIEAQ
ncbi:DNA ligase D [Niabella aquatica]